MDAKERTRVANVAVDRLRGQLFERIPMMPDHWDAIEIGWLLACLAEMNSVRARELRHRRRVFNKQVRHGGI